LIDPEDTPMEMVVKIPDATIQGHLFRGILPIEKVPQGFVCAVDSIKPCPNRSSL